MKETLKEIADLLELEYNGNAGEKKLTEIIDQAVLAMDEVRLVEFKKELVDLELEYNFPEVATPEMEKELSAEIPKGGMAVVNIGKNPHSIGGVVIKHGEGMIITAEQLEDEWLKAKVLRAVELGILEETE